MKAVLIACFDWYPNRLRPIRKLLEKRYEVTVLLSNYNHIEKKEYDMKYKGCTYISVPKYNRNFSIKRIYSHLLFGRKVKNYLNFLQPDLIYAIIPPNNVAAQCLQYKKRNMKCKYIIDVIDLWPESLPLEKLKNTFLAKQWKKIRNDSLKAADYVFIECGLYKQKLCSLLPSKKTTILYIFKQLTEKQQEYIKNLQIKNNHTTIAQDMKISLGYVGSINNIIDIIEICSVINQLIKSGYNVIFHVIGDGENKKEFLNRIKKTGCILKYYGKIYSESEKAIILSNCDFGINIMVNSVSVGLTIKSLDYFSSGLPIINNIRGDTWKFVEKYGVGVNWNNESKLNELALLDLKEARKASQKLFQEKFTEDAFVKSFQNGLKTIIKEGI